MGISIAVNPLFYLRDGEKKRFRQSGCIAIWAYNADSGRDIDQYSYRITELSSNEVEEKEKKRGEWI